MITEALENPKNIVVVGASENLSKPGGRVLSNLLNHGFKGDIYAVNRKPVNVQGTIYINDISRLPQTDLAIISIPAKYCNDVVKQLLQNGTKAFIIYSAGFSEAGEGGKKIEASLVKMINEYEATLIGPNCIGVITADYKGVFTSPIPDYDEKGCDLISSSGATAVFIMEAAASTGLTFASIYSIGNAAQVSVEEILEKMDNEYVHGKSPAVKLLYVENIRQPDKFLKHSASLVKKGCKIAAIKSGFSKAGSRAAASHTGAIASSDMVVRALFKKAGVVYCSGRNELITVACIFKSKPLLGKRLAIITHAGGSAVMLTDALESRGFKIPQIDEHKASSLLAKLHEGSSINNPIDFLATGTAKQLNDIIQFCDNYEDIDGMVVVFGSPGLFNDIDDVYEVLHQNILHSNKPIYAVLPSLINAHEEITNFIKKEHVTFPDEVVLGEALPVVYNTPEPAVDLQLSYKLDTKLIRSIIDKSKDGFLLPDEVNSILEAANIATVKSKVCNDIKSLKTALDDFSFPLAMKVVGPVHKSDVGGVSLNLLNSDTVLEEYGRMMKIKDAKGVLLQEMKKGEELYVGALHQGNFGHLVLCGPGGIFLELLKDLSYGLAPLSKVEAENMIQSLKTYPIIQGYRNRGGVSEVIFNHVLTQLSALVNIAPEIAEIDINPLIGNQQELVVVDARMLIKK
jgi:acetyltransferase